MLSLQEDFPEIHQEFMKGNFTVQLSDDVPFAKTETDKVIEMTLNKDTKTPGGTTGFSTNIGAVKRWEINASYRAKLRKIFHHHINFNLQTYKHKNLTPSRILKDERDVRSILYISNESFISPFSDQELLLISTGITVN